MALDDRHGVPPKARAPHAGLRALASSLRRLAGAHWDLLRAEFGLARSAVWWLLGATLAAMVAGVGLGLSVLALLGVALATWWGSWVWALLALCALQLAFLLGAIIAFRRCLHWLTLPRSRRRWARLLGRTSAAADDAAMGAEREPRA